jgi:hypothetical protein
MRGIEHQGYFTRYALRVTAHTVIGGPFEKIRKNYTDRLSLKGTIFPP